MLASELKAIYTNQVKNQTFFNEQLLTDLSEIEHASNPKFALIKLQTKLVGTSYESAIPALEDLAEQGELTPAKVRQQSHAILATTSAQQQAQAAASADDLIDRAPRAQLTPSALFFATAIYNQQEDLASLDKAMNYAERALQQAQLKPQLALSKRIREQYATTFDRLQLRQVPPRPQKYGTQFTPSTRELLAPNKAYQYNLTKLNQARRELQLAMLKEAERSKRNTNQAQIGGPKLTPPPDKKKLEQEEQLRRMPKCSKCGRPGHSAMMCRYVPKPSP